MKPAVTIIQIILAILLILIIIIQQKGSGLGSSFGGGGESIYRSKRGAEKLLFYVTIGIALAFIFSSIVGLLL
ncbi:preprotein translocase subunit SecG [Candidatus Daviesbacteria bacterium]|nr:preprotein translocase subunit SecG [Candidatus Daviesbacteria bacterium]